MLRDRAETKWSVSITEATIPHKMDENMHCVLHLIRESRTISQAKAAMEKWVPLSTIHLKIRDELANELRSTEQSPTKVTNRMQRMMTRLFLENKEVLVRSTSWGIAEHVEDIKVNKVAKVYTDTLIERTFSSFISTYRRIADHICLSRTVTQNGTKFNLPPLNKPNWRRLDNHNTPHSDIYQQIHASPKEM